MSYYLDTKLKKGTLEMMSCLLSIKKLSYC